MTGQLLLLLIQEIKNSILSPIGSKKNFNSINYKYCDRLQRINRNLRLMLTDTTFISQDSLAKVKMDTLLLQKVNNTPVQYIKTNILIDKAAEKGSDPQYIVYINSYSSEPWSDIINVKNHTFNSLFVKKKIFTYCERSTDKSISRLASKRVFDHSYISMNDLSLLLILISFVLIASIKAFFNKYLNQLFRTIISYSEAYKLYRDYNAIIDRVYFLLNFNLILTGSLFEFYLLKLFFPAKPIGSDYVVLILCSVFILGVYFTRYFLNKLIGFILDQKQAFDEFSHSNLLYYKVAGLFLLPVVSFLALVNVKYHFIFVLTGVFLIFIIYIISIFRATTIMFKKGILLFYWILYLCTIEFLPLLLLYKFFNAVV
jgi:hypothetical protein